MKTRTLSGSSGGLSLHPKLRMSRVRTCSSDSGCDMVSGQQLMSHDHDNVTLRLVWTPQT